MQYRLPFRINYEEKISITLKYRFTRMHFESSRKRVKKTRSMVHLRLAGDSFSNDLNDVVVRYADCYSKSSGFKFRVSHGPFQVLYAELKKSSTYLPTYMVRP
jgi:hypothetical protein